MQQLKSRAQGLFKPSANFSSQDRAVNNSNQYVVSWGVQQALDLTNDVLAEPEVSQDLLDSVKETEKSSELINTEQLFSMDGVPLPCWDETHLTLYGNWLTSPDYYPVYYSIYQKLTSSQPATRLLEIGVFTGYSGVVFARAASGKAFYLGVDPNEYLSYGLQLAGRTFKYLRQRLPNFDYTLLEGYSWDVSIQHSILLSGPFNIVHIDGDHTLRGKLVDLEIARQVIAPNGIVLVDDYDHQPCVSEAIQRAMKVGWFKKFAYVKTMRGLAVLQC